MSSVLVSVRSLMQMFDRKAKEFISEIDEVHMVWLEEIQQEANRMFSREFNAEPELMPKTPSQKKNSRRKRVSLGRQEENQARRRFSKGRRSNLRGSSVKSLNLIAEEEPVPKASSSEASNTTQQKRTTRKNKQTKPEVADVESQSTPRRCDRTEEVENKKPELVEEGEVGKNNKDKSAEIKADDAQSAAQCTPKIPAPEVVVSISPEERRSAEFAKNADASLGRTATKITIAETTESSRQSSVRYSLKLRRSMAGLRHSMTQESVRRASRRSMLKRKANCMGNSTSSSNCDAGDAAFEEDGRVIMEDEPAHMEDEPEDDVAQKSSEIQTNQQVERVTRSVAANAPKLLTPTLFYDQPKVSTPVKKSAAIERLTSQAVRRSSRSTKRKSPDTVESSPTKRFSPPKKSQSVMKPSMKSFLHTVQKNQLLMMTPNSVGRAAVIKSFIKHTTPLKVDSKTKELFKLEALKKKQEQEEERMKKMEEEKKKKHEELKRRRDERIKKVLEARAKEEQREEEKKKKIEQKMAQIDGKNDKRLAEENAKKKVAMKRQEELELKRKLEEEAKKKKLQQEEEKRQQELLAKKKAEEEEQQARKALELKMKQEQREREMALQRERQAAAERERMEKEKALRELERAAREKEMQELEEKRKALEEKRKLEEQQRLAAKERALKEKEEAKQREAAAKERALKEKEEAKQREAAAKQATNAQTSAALNVTVDIERSVLSTPARNGGGLNVTVDLTKSSPQSYIITPKGASKPPAVLKSQDDYGMDLNSDDSTDDESAPRKPIPSWAEGPNLKQILMKQYFTPPDLDSFFGIIEPPKLENIFYKSKPRYFKRTSSAVWHSPPAGAK